MEEKKYIEAGLEEACELKSFERNKYFYGKLMTVRDFETEQRYFNEKRHLLNRLIHGIGIVCGLAVLEPEIVDEKLRIKLSPGVALDCCGREIVVENGGTFDISGSLSPGVNYLYLKYRECLKESVPARSNPSVCEEVCCYSRIKEDFELEVSKTGPPAATTFAWKEVWQNRKHDIEEVANKLGTPDPEGSLKAKLIVTAAEYLKTVGCPSCDDPKVLLAVINIVGTTVEVDEDETLALRSIVYSNPMLYELLQSHLTDLDNPHQVTAEQTKALMSINNVGNEPDKEEWVQNVDVSSPDGTITVDPIAVANTINIKTTHAQINPLEVNPALTDKNRDKHVSNADANRWNKSLVSVDGVANPGGNVDLVEGDGIKIDPIAAEHKIKISAPGAAGEATTGVLQLTIPRATSGVGVIAATAIPGPGHIMKKDIRHQLETKLPPAVILGLVTEKGIIMEEDFISQRELIEILAKAYEVPAPPPVSFRALKVDNEKFDILAVNLNPEVEETILIRWWAIPAARSVGEMPIDRIPIERLIGIIRTDIGDEPFDRIAAERGIPSREASSVIGSMIEAISATPSGITAANIAKAIKVKKETIEPLLNSLVKAAEIKATGRGASRKFMLKG